MRKLTTAIILATAGIVTTSAMAAPHDHNDMRHGHHAAYHDKKPTGVRVSSHQNSTYLTVIKSITADIKAS